VPRKDGDPPRGVAEQGHPRQEELTRDAQTPVDSLNNASGDGNEPFLQKEIKPRIEDVCVNICILEALAESGDLAVLTLLFDYEYFFHQLVYEMAKIWKLGFALHARRAEGGAHPNTLDVLLELIMSMGWTRASLIAQQPSDAIVWMLQRHVTKALEGYVEEQKRSRPASPTSGLSGRRYRMTTTGRTHACRRRCSTPTTCSLAWSGQQRLRRPSPASAGSSARHSTCARTRRTPRAAQPGATWSRCAETGSSEASHASGAERSAPSRERSSSATTRESSTAREAAQAATHSTGQLRWKPHARSLVFSRAANSAATCKTSPAYVNSLCTRRRQRAQGSLWAWLKQLQHRVGVLGKKVAVRCGCMGAVTGEPCHCVIVCQHVEQQLDIAKDVARGPPPDPVREVPTPAQGLNMAAAGVHKWHIGGGLIWIGCGLSATHLLTWVPQHKAAALLRDITNVFAGRCDVASYRSFVGTLQDVLKTTGGGFYRMKGLFAPLGEDAELGEGPYTIVRLRKQMKARLVSWQHVLANRPGASMLGSAVGPDASLKTDQGIIWVLAGDATKKDGELHNKIGLGCFFYGIWWNVPLTLVPHLNKLHITCLELIEIGLDIVIVSPWLAGAKHVRLVSDTLATVCALCAWCTDENAPARDSKAATLAAVHEYLIRQPEWKALHEPTIRDDVAQAFGERLLMADAASRGHEATLRDVCSAIGIDPRKLNPLPERAHAFLRGAAEAAWSVMSGDPVIEHGPYPYGTEVVKFMAHNILRHIANKVAREWAIDTSARATFLAAPTTTGDDDDTAARVVAYAQHEPTSRGDAAQTFGERPTMANAASRGHEATRRDVCAVIGRDPRKLDPPPLDPPPERARASLRGTAEAAGAPRAATPRSGTGRTLTAPK